MYSINHISFGCFILGHPCVYKLGQNHIYYHSTKLFDMEETALEINLDDDGDIEINSINH